MNFRPHVRDCLRALSETFEIIVFSRSTSCYASPILDYLDPKRELISHRLFQENCVLAPNGFFIKDLGVISNRKLEDIMLVDSSPYAYFPQINHGIPILPFTQNKRDNELEQLVSYGRVLSKANDMVEFNRNYFRSYLFLTEASLESVKLKMFK